MSQYDIIVIGAGHNGLTAATSLARKGKRVLVLEKENQVGGLVTSGVLRDTSLVRSSVVKELRLEGYGLELMGVRVPVVLLGKNGEGLLLTGNHEEVAGQIAEYSEKDAVAYFEFRKFLKKITPLLEGVMNEVPPDIKSMGIDDIWSLSKKAIGLKRLGKETMLEFLRIAPMCVADYLNEWFETDFVKAGLAAPALYGSFTGPWSAGTNLNFLIYEALAREEVKGGALSLIAALEKGAADAGVDILTDAEVDEIVLDGGAVTGVKVGEKGFNAAIVMSSCSIKHTVLNLLAPMEVNHDTETQIANLRARGTTAIVDLAFDGAVKFKCGKNVGLYRTGNSFDEMERAFDSSKYCAYSEHPLLEIRVSSDRKRLNILTHYAPFDLDSGWTDEARNELLANVKNELSLYINDEANLIESSLLSPTDIERNYCIPGGHIFHAEHAIDQLITRPFPSFMQYKTSIPGLFHCGSSAHPGGGLTCAPGFLAASTL